MPAPRSTHPAEYASLFRARRVGRDVGGSPTPSRRRGLEVGFLAFRFSYTPVSVRLPFLRRTHHLHSRENHPIARSPQNFDGRPNSDFNNVPPGMGANLVL